jgi:2-dehydropantoate 2-reductase
MTRYVFIGAGAIGSAVGGLLAQQGTEVLLVARGDHARAMIADGLTLRCPDTTITVPAPTVTGPEDVRLTTDDVLVLSTKSHQAEAAVHVWADVPVFPSPNSAQAADAAVGRAAELLPILIALNGVAAEDIALRYFDRVFGVCVWFPAVLIEPGEVIVRGAAPIRGIFHVGRYGTSTDPSADAQLLGRVGNDWDAAGCRIARPERVMAWKYRKLISNLGNALQALLGDGGKAAELRTAVDSEAREVLAAAGIEVTSDAEERAARSNGFTVQPVPGEPAELGGSSWQSLVRGTGTIESDYLNGEIALIARRIGSAAPINAKLAALARQAARNGQQPGDMTADQLRETLGI